MQFQPESCHPECFMERYKPEIWRNGIKNHQGIVWVWKEHFDEHNQNYAICQTEYNVEITNRDWHYFSLYNEVTAVVFQSIYRFVKWWFVDVLIISV